MKDIILGKGMLGWAFHRALPDAMFYGRPQVDLNNPNFSPRIIEYQRPDRVFLCAYNANVDNCETNVLSWEANIGGCLEIALACKKIGAKLIFPSSSYVFDGMKKTAYSVNDDPNPINVYGAQKLLFERILEFMGLDYLVFRTVGVFGFDPKRKNFAYQVIDRFLKNEKIVASDREWMNPVHVDFLVRSVIDYLNHDVSGIVHIAGNASTNKYMWARNILDQYFKSNGIEDFAYSYVEDGEIEKPAKRPHIGTLQSTRMEHMPYREMIKLFVENDYEPE